MNDGSCQLVASSNTHSHKFKVIRNGNISGVLCNPASSHMIESFELDEQHVWQTGVNIVFFHSLLVVVGWETLPTFPVICNSCVLFHFLCVTVFQGGTVIDSQPERSDLFFSFAPTITLTLVACELWPVDNVDHTATEK